MASGVMVASVSVLGALFSLSSPSSALDLVFLWQDAQLLLNRGCAAMRSAGPAIGSLRRAGCGGWAYRAAVATRSQRKFFMNPASILGYLSKNSRKTECGADLFLVRLAVRARTLY